MIHLLCTLSSILRPLHLGESNMPSRNQGIQQNDHFQPCPTPPTPPPPHRVSPTHPRLTIHIPSPSAWPCTDPCKREGPQCGLCGDELDRRMHAGGIGQTGLCLWISILALADAGVQTDRTRDAACKRGCLAISYIYIYTAFQDPSWLPTPAPALPRPPRPARHGLVDKVPRRRRRLTSQIHIPPAACPIDAVSPA